MKFSKMVLLAGKRKRVPRGFIIEVTVSGNGTARTITLPLADVGVFNCKVNWGDGSALSEITAYNSVDRIHTYSANGVYQIEITGECPSIRAFSTDDQLKITDVIYWGDSKKFGGFRDLGISPTNAMFYNCKNLKSLGSGKILAKEELLNVVGLFRQCSKITYIPKGLFDNCVGFSAYGFHSTFRGCSSLTSIPTDLFRYNTLVSSNGFGSTFYDCSSLTSIPTDLFRYNTAVSLTGFYFAFHGCSRLTSIPTDLFRYNTAVSSDGFGSTFRGCSSLTSIPTDLFRYNTLVSSNGFQMTFYQCHKLQLNSRIFFAPGEESTRFKDKTISFQQCFYRSGAFTGTKGTAPELWNCNFGTGTVTKTGCFQGHSADTLTNYNSIPAEWR